MSSYTTEEIRRAFLDARGNYGVRDVDTLLRELREAKANHEFADTDTITVKEFREACANIKDAFTDDSMLTWIYEHREPKYQVGTVVRDAIGHCYLRAARGSWLRFGTTETFPDDKPRRPLKRMEVV